MERRTFPRNPLVPIGKRISVPILLVKKSPNNLGSWAEFKAFPSVYYRGSPLGEPMGDMSDVFIIDSEVAFVFGL